jgi:uncharacterized membrane protein
LGDQFLLLTTLTILLTIAFPRYFERLRGTQEIGTYLIYLFFVVIGIPADLRIILMNAPLLLAFVFVVAMSNLLVTLAAGKLLRFRLEEILLACTRLSAVRQQRRRWRSPKAGRASSLRLCWSGRSDI